MNLSVLLAVRHTSRDGDGDNSSSERDQILSASGFFLGPSHGRSTRRLVVSSASWLSPSMDIVLVERLTHPAGIEWSWKKQPPPDFCVLEGVRMHALESVVIQNSNNVMGYSEQDSQKPKTFLVTFVGLFLMPSVLSALRNSLSSLSHWRASVSGQDFINDDTKTHHIPLESLLLPLACLAVFEVDHPTTVERDLQLCDKMVAIGSRVFVSATPFASYCPEVFLNSVMAGCVSKLLDVSGSVFLIDASTVQGCEGGVVFHDHFPRSPKSSTNAVCGMVLSSLTSQGGQPTGLSLACSSSAITEALQQIRPSSVPVALNDSSTLSYSKSLKNPSAKWDEMKELTVLITTKVGWGSGILLTPSLALTCNHVITNPQNLKVHSSIAREVTDAIVTYSSAIPDLAIVKLNQPIESKHLFDAREQLGESVKHRTLSSSSLKLNEGDEIVVFGYGLQYTLSSRSPSSPLLSVGVVSKVVYDGGEPVLFVTTAAVNPGMSGGLVASAKSGQLLGMVVSSSQIEEGGALYPRINYCLPFSWLLPAVERYVSDGELTMLLHLSEWGQKVKYLWQLQSNHNFHWPANRMLSSKL